MVVGGLVTGALALTTGAARACLWAGLAATVVGETGNFAAYGFAGASLIAPLGAVSVLANAFIAALVLRWWSPAQAEHLLERLRGTWLYGAARARLGDAATRTRLTRVSVSLYFVHEGCQAWQLKWAELSSSMVPLLTPFGPMRMMPHWQKGDATDLVLLVTAVLTAANVLKRPSARALHARRPRLGARRVPPAEAGAARAAGRRAALWI